MTALEVGQEELAEALRLGSSTVYEGLREDWWVDPAIRPVWPGAKIAAPAFTVKCGYGDNLALQRAVRDAPAGSVLVVDSGRGEYGYWGNVLSEVAVARGLAGLIIDGTVRDVEEIENMKFPIFSVGIAMRHADKSQPGELGGSIVFGGRDVRAGDIVVADSDGVVITPAVRWEEAFAAAKERARNEEARIGKIRSGAIPELVMDAPADSGLRAGS